MKLVVAGSRNFKLNIVDLWGFLALYGFALVDEIVSGGATGIDATAKEMAPAYQVKYKEFAADWDRYGRKAGPLRNKKMAVYGDALLLVWDGESPGSASMKKEMLNLNKPVYEVILRIHNEKK
jgi:hypothetical protein